jgi:hypothetical protein
VAVRHFKSEDQFILCIDDISINNFVNCQKWSHNFSLNLDATSLTEENIYFDIYPNPVNDKLYIETETEIKEVVVYDVYGRVQNLRNSKTQKLRNSIDVTDLNSGVYFVKIVTSEGEVVKRIIKG